MISDSIVTSIVAVAPLWITMAVMSDLDDWRWWALLAALLWRDVVVRLA